MARKKKDFVDLAAEALYQETHSKFHGMHSSEEIAVITKHMRRLLKKRKSPSEGAV